MWKIAKNVYNIPFRDSMISESDERDLTFPILVDVFDIYLKSKDNLLLHLSDDRMRNINYKQASEGDVIVISFIPRINDKISVNMIMEDIYSYATTYVNYGKNSFESVKINITTGGETLSHIPKVKYNVSMPWADLIDVEANIVYLSEAKYIK